MVKVGASLRPFSPLEAVISVSTKFNAYGEPMPAGVEQYRAVHYGRPGI